MLEMRSGRLALPALEDANAVQMAIMRVQKALIDDEISDKKAGLLLYSLQMASSNLKHTTFTDSKKEVVREMPEAAVSTQHSALSNGNNLPRINADERGSKPAVSTQRSAFSQKRLSKVPPLPESELETETKAKTFTTEVAEEHRGKGKPQPKAAVPHERRVGSGL
jgi:hypothetical protein